MRRLTFVGFLAVAACSAPAPQIAAKDETPRQPIIIAHRGASGELPEHTIEAYTLAIEQGADFIEPDLVMTKDGVLVVRHDRYLSTSTNVANLPEFADRKRADTFPSRLARNDWWAEDFTLEEIRTLKARQARSGRSKAFDDLYTIPTFDEVLALSAARGIGVYPEVKAPSHHANIGLDLKAPLLEALKDHPTPVFIQSFEAGILRELNQESDWPLVQLYSRYLGAKFTGNEPTMQETATYADGIGPSKMIMTPTPSAYVARAHALGLQVHPYTFRTDDLAEGMTFEDELKVYVDAGVDGVFTDHPGAARAARDAALPPGK